MGVQEEDQRLGRLGTCTGGTSCGTMRIGLRRMKVSRSIAMLGDVERVALEAEVAEEAVAVAVCEEAATWRATTV